MGIKHKPILPPTTSLADALFPKVRQRVLAVLFNAPERSFYMGEVIALAHSGTGAVQRELADLAAAGILSVHKQSKQKHYQVNAQSPVFAALRDLVGKTMGVVNVLNAALSQVARQVDAAFVHAEPPAVSGAKPTAVTVVLCGRKLANVDVASAVADAMQVAANTLARQLRFTLYTPETLASAVAHNSNFRSRLLQPPKTWLVGSEDQLFSQAP
jgi:hypothetical protein